MDTIKLATNIVNKKNKMTSFKEVSDFIKNKPEKYFGYPSRDGKEFTTWIGDKLGTITRKGQSYKSNMGDIRVSVDVLSINGCRYSGTMYGGNYIRLKRLKQMVSNTVTI